MPCLPAARASREIVSPKTNAVFASNKLARAHKRSHTFIQPHTYACRAARSRLAFQTNWGARSHTRTLTQRWHTRSRRSLARRCSEQRIIGALLLSRTRSVVRSNRARLDDSGLKMIALWHSSAPHFFSGRSAGPFSHTFDPRYLIWD